VTDKKIQKDSPGPLNAKEVRDYLVRHPEFFEQNPDLLYEALPASEYGEGVEDFRSHLLEKLQEEVRSLKNFHGSLISASRSNQTTQHQVHEAVLALLEAESLDHLCHIVTQDWVQYLHVDVISICFETFASDPPQKKNSIRSIEKGAVNSIMGPDHEIVLRNDSLSSDEKAEAGSKESFSVSQEVFGPATPLIKAEALIRIAPGDLSPVGILAFGSREQDFFTPGQGTEMLRFLEAAFRASLKHWLKKNTDEKI